MSEYKQDARNVLPNGLTLLQVNPDYAARLSPSDAKDFGWLFYRGSFGQWVTCRKLSPDEMEEANDQAADMMVRHGAKVRIA